MEVREMATYTVIKILDDRNPRRRARRLDAEDLAERTWADAVEAGRDAARCAHGGSVAASYGYPSVTDAVVAVALYDLGVVIVAASDLSANGVTLSGAAGVAWRCAEVRALWDCRFGAAAKSEARARLYASARTIAALAPGAEERRWTLCWVYLATAIRQVEATVQARFRARFAPTVAPPAEPCEMPEADAPGCRFAGLDVSDPDPVRGSSAPTRGLDRIALLDVEVQS
jgi:hypothetical protein